MKKKIELCMVLLLLFGAIVASWKLSKWTTDVAKENVTAKGTNEIVIVIDPGHGASQLRQN